jgi:hypothetical protein
LSATSRRSQRIPKSSMSETNQPSSRRRTCERSPIR